MTDSALSAAEARTELYDIIRGDIEFETKAQQALELGCAYLDAEHGFLTHIDQATDSWEVLVSTDPSDGAFPPGLEFELGTTYCRRTIAAESSVSFHDAPNQGLEADPAFAASGYHCYHGTKLIVDDEPYGTVCFLAEDPRADGFSDGETMFAELVAQLIERELERTTHETEIRRQANLTEVLNRVLRHNLRNDMTVIRGRTQVIADELDGNEHVDIVLDQIDGLIELAETARELAHVVEESGSPRDVHLKEMLTDAVERVKPDYPAASFALDCAADVTVTVAESLELALSELIENAAKHAGDAPAVTVSVETSETTVDIHVADDGPGLSKQERDVLKDGAESPLVHGSGLGLWLVHWVVTNHDGTVDTAVSTDGTTMTVCLPRHADARNEVATRELSGPRDQYRAAFENASDVMLITDDDGRIADANAAATDLLALDREALLGRLLPEFLPDSFEFEEHWTAFQSDGVDRGTVTLVAADGTAHTIEYAGSADVVPGQHLFIAREVTAA